MTDKATLRSIGKERRFALTLSERREKSCRITETAKNILSNRNTILAYVSKDPEVETLVFINYLLSLGKTVAVPIIEKDTHTLRLSKLESVADLEPSTFNVPEPISHEKPISPEKIETVLIPIVGFDRKGNRLGYGAGYYDRFLFANPKLEKVGFAYACQEFEEIPADENDIKLDMIITENEVVNLMKK